MLDLDSGLFQTLTLVLLVALLVLLLVLMNGIAQLRRELASHRLPEPGRGFDAGQSTAAMPGEAGGDQPSRAFEPEPMELAPMAEAGEETIPAAADLEAEAETPEPTPVATAFEPMPDAGEAGDASPAGGPGTAEEEPQDQPYERDGRWWFRRGDELLAYDESTGTWVPAPAESGGGSVQEPAAAGTERTFGDLTAASATSSFEPALAGASPAEAAVSTETAGAYWKCPSCGAVNGSTAASCRMCFTARP